MSGFFPKSKDLTTCRNSSLVIGQNELLFYQPFAWDGTSNIIVEFYFENDIPSANSFVFDAETITDSTALEYVGRNGQEVDTPLQVPITFEGFECYLWDLGIISHLSDYSANTNGNYDEYSTIITRIKQNCFVHNFKGASVGVFNHNIIARKLGLIDKQETKHEGEIVIFKGINLDVPTDDSAE